MSTPITKISLPAASHLRSSAFMYGVATSAFQIEGAADARLPSIWDRFCERDGTIADGSNGQVACDHYHRWQEDVELMVELGLDAYRFSISWPRVVKADGSPNHAGLDFYKRLLDELNDRAIKPFVTLYHWDLPQYLEDVGGWQERDTAWRFLDYADLVTRALGDRVYSYATLNEPFCSAYLGYELGIHAPGIASKAAGNSAAHHLLLAHGLSMGVLRTNSPHSLNGIVLNFTPAYPASTSDEDAAAAAMADEENNQWYLRPVMEGAYPELLHRLPEHERPMIHDGDMTIIAAPLDYIGVNYYTRGIYQGDQNGGYREVKEPSVPRTAMGWEVYPAGLTDLLISISEQYELPPIYITENGTAAVDVMNEGQIDDFERIRYLQTHLEAIHHAVEAGVRVDGYFCWSLMDNFEWAEGYSKNFGLVHVDYQTQQRTMKASGNAYRELLGQRRSARVMV